MGNFIFAVTQLQLFPAVDGYSSAFQQGTDPENGDAWAFRCHTEVPCLWLWILILGMNHRVLNASIWQGHLSLGRNDMFLYEMLHTAYYWGFFNMFLLSPDKEEGNTGPCKQEVSLCKRVPEKGQGIRDVYSVSLRSTSQKKKKKKDLPAKKNPIKQKIYYLYQY